MVWGCFFYYGGTPIISYQRSWISLNTSEYFKKSCCLMLKRKSPEMGASTRQRCQSHRWVSRLVPDQQDYCYGVASLISKYKLEKLFQMQNQEMQRNCVL
ncbi:hypothetical protein ATANTOWER_015115 [Ataeniobius toweri]|uniref:Uncharacterized protein n=1 Tax=Ataeniobius toweri TaxID=208326 RepID=A0ABU7BQP9_9TELE|nr:hypothetical protein [Ataeniobius toweri]